MALFLSPLYCPAVAQQLVLAAKRSFWATPLLLPFAFELHGSDNNYMAAALGEQRRRKREGLRGSGGGVGWAGGVGKRGGESNNN